MRQRVQIAYAIGVAEPVSVYVEPFGTEHQDIEFINQYVRENYDLTPRGIIDSLGLLNADYNKVSAYRHFGKMGFLWASKKILKIFEMHTPFPPLPDYIVGA